MPKKRQNFVFGYHASLEALKNNQVEQIFIAKNNHRTHLDKIKELAQKNNVALNFVGKDNLDKLTNNAVHQGLVAKVANYNYLSLAELLTKTKTATPFFLILDSLEDPHNFGSILRSADAAGVNGIIIPKHRAVGVTPVVASVASGALQYVPIAQVTNLTDTIKKLKQAGFWIFGTDMKGKDFRNWNTKGKIALIVGNEGRGISAGLKKQVDEILTIPMIGHVQSLNVGVATGLLIYEVFRNRN